MKKFIILLFVFIAVENCVAQSARDSAAIRATALNYAEGWYEGNAERMAKTLHSQLVKRSVGPNRDYRKNENILNEMNFDQLLDGTTKGYGKKIPKERQIKNITILSIYNNSASVKTEMADWVDFMHLVRWNGDWKIINVLWEMKPQE